MGNVSFAMAMRIDSFVRLKNNTATGNGQNAIAIYDSWPGRSGTWVKDNLPYTLVNYAGINSRPNPDPRTRGDRAVPKSRHPVDRRRLLKSRRHGGPAHCVYLR